MRLTGMGGEDGTSAASGVAGAAPPDVEQHGASEADTPHDHAQRLQERPRIFASSHLAEAALRAQLQSLVGDDGEPGVCVDPGAGDAGDAAASAVEQRAPAGGATSAAAAAEPALDDVRAGGSLLRVGSSGPEVEALQQALNAAGIQPPLEVNGRFDASLAEAVRGFQQANGCQVDGIVGPETLGAIDRARGLDAHPAAAEASARYAGRGGGGGRSDPVGGGADPTQGPGAGGTAGTGGATGLDGASGVAASGDVPAYGRVDPSSLTGLDRIIDRTVRFESGGRYDAWNADDNGHGVSFGLIQFNQEVGSLPGLFERMNRADPGRFNEIFGPHARNLLDEGWVRDANLNDPDIRARMERAGRDPGFQQVQRDMAREQYLEPAQRLASEHGITSERGLAMLFDSCVQNGRGGTARYLRQAREGGGSEREILTRFAGLADRGRSRRRQRILNDPNFSDGPVGSGGAAGSTGSTARASAARGEPRMAEPSTRTSGGTGGGSTTSATDSPRTFGRGAGGSTAEAPAGADSAGGVEAAGGTSRAAAASPTTDWAPIGPGSRVLMIGDSHTVGAYGNEMDRLLRSTGATVESYGSSGSSASWWLNGTDTRSGFVARHADGSVDRPDWRTPHDTPLLADLIREHRPDTLVVSLGGNMRGSSPEAIRRQVRELAEVARENGVRLVWVGSPERRADDADPAEYQRFLGTLREAVEPYGRFVDSSRHSDYAGGDGVHYTGVRGTARARSWAGGVFEEIQGGGR